MRPLFESLKPQVHGKLEVMAPHGTQLAQAEVRQQMVQVQAEEKY